MRIKNVGKCKIIFKGGSLDAGKVGVFNNGTEKLGAALLKAYPNNLLDLDNIKKEEVVEVVFDGEKEAQKASKAPAKKSKKK